MSCASCHNDGGGDGRVWDLSGFGEGLRNTVDLRGRAGTGARPAALDEQLRRGAGLRGPDPHARGRQRSARRRALLRGHARAAARRSEGRPLAPTSTRSPPTSPRSRARPRARSARAAPSRRWRSRAESHSPTTRADRATAARRSPTARSTRATTSARSTRAAGIGSGRRSTASTRRRCSVSGPPLPTSTTAPRPRSAAAIAAHAGDPTTAERARRDRRLPHRAELGRRTAAAGALGMGRTRSPGWPCSASCTAAAYQAARAAIRGASPDR